MTAILAYIYHSLYLGFKLTKIYLQEELIKTANNNKLFFNKELRLHL